MVRLRMLRSPAAVLATTTMVVAVGAAAPASLAPGITYTLHSTVLGQVVAQMAGDTA